MKTPGRQSIRLKGYDYARPGAYFVTVCVRDRLCLFGDVTGDAVVLNDAGVMIQNVWESLPLFNPGVTLDEYIVMPNHFHGIIVLDGRARWPAHPTISLPDVMQRFKSITTALYRRGKWPGMNGRLWQRNYYEHIIRNETELQRIREYIQHNPANWPSDPENPSRCS